MCGDGGSLDAANPYAMKRTYGFSTCFESGQYNILFAPFYETRVDLIKIFFISVERNE